MSRYLGALVWGVAALACVGCDGQARRILTVACPQDASEGGRTQVTITITNPFGEPMIALALSLYARPNPMEYLVKRETLGEVEYYKPLQATEVRHLQTLDQIQVDHMRDAGEWRHVPDSRFLHPRILLPGQCIAETFQFQAMRSHRRLLYCDFYYLPWSNERARGRLFVRTKGKEVPPDAEHYTEVYTRVDQAKFGDPEPKADNYLLYRPARIYDRPPELVTQEVRLDVQPLKFPYEQAARRARLGARTTCYFAGAGAWVFEYADDGTWFVSPDAVVKLKGRYADFVADIQRRQATVITLAAPRKADDKLLQLFEKAGYSDPTAKGPNAVATIPGDGLLTALEQAESLGYTIEPTTWKPMP